MREIIFRGKTGGSGKWAYGSLIHIGDFCAILGEDNLNGWDGTYLEESSGLIDGRATLVLPETVGQFTGLLDKNGQKIFEGDIMNNAGNVVEYCNDGFCINGDSSLCYWTKTEIIGNIHDNPELA